jgi:hypothetical protein
MKQRRAVAIRLSVHDQQDAPGLKLSSTVHDQRLRERIAVIVQ